MLNLRRVLDVEGIPVKSVADIWKCSDKTVKNKTAGRTDITYKEAKAIKGILPKYDLDYLLADEKKLD
jgi:hypothetical protein